MQIIMSPSYHEHREAHPDDYEKEDHSPKNLRNYFQTGSPTASVTTSSSGVLDLNGYIYKNFK